MPLCGKTLASRRVKDCRNVPGNIQFRPATPPRTGTVAAPTGKSGAEIGNRREGYHGASGKIYIAPTTAIDAYRIATDLARS